MQYTVARNGQTLGQYFLPQLQQGIANETLFPTDLVWTAGMSEWAPLSDVLDGRSGFAPVAALTYPGAPLPIGAIRTSGLAVTSLVLGILSVFLSCITGVPAIIFGHVALSQIKSSMGMIEGKGMAIAGLIFGYLCTVGLILLYVFLFSVASIVSIPLIGAATIKATIAQNEASAHELVAACRSYAGDHQGLLPSNLSELVESHVLSADKLSNANSLQIPTWKGNPGFEYLGDGVRDTADGTVVVLRSKSESTDHERIVAHLNGSVELSKRW